MSGSVFSTTVIRKVFAPRSNRVTTRSSESNRVAQQQPSGRRLQPDFGHLDQLLVDVIDIKHVGEQQYRRRQIIFKAHSARSRHPQLAGGDDRLPADTCRNRAYIVRILFR